MIGCPSCVPSDIACPIHCPKWIVAMLPKEHKKALPALIRKAKKLKGPPRFTLTSR